jgi:hypothetical protein
MGLKRDTCTHSFAVVFLLLVPTIGFLLTPTPLFDIPSEVFTESALEPPLHWSDSFDDTTKIGVTRDVVVGGGLVVLTNGENKGIVSSEAIDCPAGYYFDWLVVKADTTGNSSVTVAVLNATEASQQAGYVNEPIPGYELARGLERDLRDIDPADYPSIRIQANLEVNGSFRPAIYSWTIALVKHNEWRDDLIGTGKMIQRSSMIFANDSTISMDLVRQLRYAVHERDEYEKYPIIISNRFWHSNNLPLYIFYPNASGTGYGPGDMMGDESPRGFAVADLDEDGYDDLYVSNFQYDEVRNVTSYILWGNESGRWSLDRTTNLTDNGGGSDAVVGDFNGDGLLDLANLAWNDGFEKIYVYPNPGHRGFGPAPSIKLSALSVLGLASGDLNGDGYDDLVAAEDWNGESSAYFGGPNGPDHVRDIIFQTGRGKDVKIRDLNEDGFLDVLFAGDHGGKTYIYMGGPGGPDTTPEYSLKLDDWPSGVDVGDMNGDGHLDLLFTRTPGVNAYMWFYPGSRNGWSDTTKRIINMDDGTRDVEVIDLDKDGIDDAVISGYYTKCRLHYGTSSGIKAAADDVLGAIGTETLCIGIPPKPLEHATSRIITHTIDRPASMKWDIAYVDAQVPTGTRLIIDVLDRNMRPIPGLYGIEATDVDLSPVGDDKIHLRVTLISDDRVSSPVVNGLLVKWMEVDEWREEFYGRAKTERLVGLDVMDGRMVIGSPSLVGDEILIPSLRSDTNLRGTLSTFMSTGSGEYASIAPIDLERRYGHSAVAVRDVNHDNYRDAVLASYRTSETNYSALSPFYYGTSVGFEHAASHEFPTTGATDVVLIDLNGDGYQDVVFAQEQDGTTYNVNSTLFWGNQNGWNATPDVEFTTTGASAVIPAFIDGDDLVDLVFACYRAGTTDIDSMVFVQESAGFCGTVPSSYLGTKGARDVAVGDLDDDGAADLVFANSFANGFVETDSYIYWGLPSGGFDPVPTGIETVGAYGVEIYDVDDDNDDDLVFANHIDDYNDRSVNSYIYLNDGAGSFASTPDHQVATQGAVAVGVADLDNSGWLDLVFACQFDGSTYDTPSMVYLGGSTGWGAQPTYTLPTTGASDVLVRNVVANDREGYISQAIRPRDPIETGAFEDLSYDLSSTVNDNGVIMVVDADTWEVLFQETLFRGSRSFVLRDEFSVRDHPSIRILITVMGADSGRNLEIDDLRLNWSKRVKVPPVVNSIQVVPKEVKRMDSTAVQVTVSDEFDVPEDLKVTIEAKLNVSTTWSQNLIGTLRFEDGRWNTTFNPTSHTEMGLYDLRARAEDHDFMVSEYLVFGSAIEVMNNAPSPPEIILEPVRPLTMDEITVTMTRRGYDRENEGLSYRYSWYVDGEAREDLVADSVDPGETAKGQNWSVEVRSYDGHDLSEPVSAWVVIGNSPPTRTTAIPPASIDEDSGPQHWIDLMDHFTDPDDDVLLWALDPEPVHISVVVADNGSVTIEPEADWNGDETIRFVLTDGEFFVNASGLVTVRPVNDGPTIVAVNGISVTGDVVELSGTQDVTVVINITVIDKEGDVLVYSTNLSEVILGTDPSNISFVPDNDDVGVIRFYMSVKEEGDPDLSDRIEFVLTVENANDPMDLPMIEHPLNGSRFEVGEKFWLNGSCFDPDLRHGQVLHFKWTSDISGDLGVFDSVQVAIDEVGNHTIILRVDDGFTSKTAVVVVVVYEVEAPPPPPPPTPEEGSNLWIVVLVLVVASVLGAALFVMRRSAEETPEPVEEEVSEEDRQREMLSEMAGIAGEAADVIEKDKDS